MKLCCWFILCLCAVVDVGFAEVGGLMEIKLDGYDIRDIIIEDNKVWCVSPGDGVFEYNMFDGSYTKYTTEDGLLDNRVSSVAIGNNDVKWFVSETGVNSFNGENLFAFTKTEMGYDRSVNFGIISNIAVDKYYTKWFLTSRGLFTYNDTTWNYLRSGRFSDILFDKNSIAWIAHTGIKSSYYKGEWKNHFDEDYPVFEHTVCVIDHNNIQFWGGWDGLRIIDGDNITTYSEIHGEEIIVTSLAVDSNNVVWFGNAGGLWKYDKYEFAKVYDFYENEPYINEIKDIEFDKDGLLWIVVELGRGGRVLAKYTPETPLSVSNNPTPQELSLNPATPNPFNAQTTLSFTLPSESMTTLSIYDINGRKVRELVSGTMSAGTHSIVWNGKDAMGETVASGVYLSRLVSGGMVKSGRMAFVK